MSTYYISTIGGNENPASFGNLNPHACNEQEMHMLTAYLVEKEEEERIFPSHAFLLLYIVYLIQINVFTILYILICHTVYWTLD